MLSIYPKINIQRVTFKPQKKKHILVVDIFHVHTWKILQFFFLYTNLNESSFHQIFVSTTRFPYFLPL